MMSQSDYEDESDDGRSVSSKGSSSSRRLRKSKTGSVAGGLEPVKNPRRKPRNMDRMSAADLVFRNSCNDSTDTFNFSADESDWVTDLDTSESESENEAPASSLSLKRSAATAVVKPAIQKLKPDMQKLKPDMQKIKPDIQKIGGSESDWFSEFSESEAEFAGQPPAKSLEKKKKTTKTRTAGQTKREADAHQANSEDIQTEKSASKKKGKTSSRKPVKVSKQSRGRESNRGEEVEDDERSASRSVSRRPESTPKKSEESAKRSSKRTSGEHALPSTPSLDDSKTPNTRGRKSNRGGGVEDDERSASRSVSRRPESTPKKSKESAKRSSKRPSAEHVLPNAPLLDSSTSQRKTESTKTPSTPSKSSKKKVSNGNDEGRRGRSPSQSGIPFQIAIEDPADEQDALIKEAKERKSLADQTRRTPFCDRSLSVTRHRVRDRSRSVSRTRESKGRNAADIPLVDDRDMGKRGQSGKGYLPTAYDGRNDHSPTKEHSASGYDSATGNSRPSLDGLFSRRRDDVLSTSASLSGAPTGKLVSDSASLGGDMRPNPRSRKPQSQSLKVDSLNWSGAMDNLLSERRQRPSTMESPYTQKPKLGSSDISHLRSASKLDVDSLYNGMPKRGNGANPMESSTPKLGSSRRTSMAAMSRPTSASRLDVGPMWEYKEKPLLHTADDSVDDSGDPKFGHRIGAVLTSAQKHTKYLSDISGISTGINGISTGINGISTGISGISTGISALSGGGQPAGHSALGSPKRNAAAAAKQPAKAKSPPKRSMNASGHSRDADRRHPMPLGAPPLY